MKVLEGIKELIEEELKDIKKKGCLTPAELESVHKAVETIMYIDKICKEEEIDKSDEEYSGYSGRKMPRVSMNGYSGHYFPPAVYEYPNNYINDYPNNYVNDYSGNYSGTRYMHSNDYSGTHQMHSNDYSGCRRDSYGRYGSNGYDRMYSREGATSNMIERLETMLDAAPTDRERDAIRNCINNLTWH